MFLGWIFNLLSLAFIHEHIAEDRRRKYINLFLSIQVLLLGMLISFPLQGYGLYSIAISTLHTVLVGVFALWFFRDTRTDGFDASKWFARMALIFFLISAIGPFTLGPLMINGLGQTKWYYFAVYYYLHFQYNGVFTFGVFSLLFGMIKDKGITLDQGLIKKFGYLLMYACFPAYFLSTLWAEPGIIFNTIGFIAALMQLATLYYLLKILRVIPGTVRKELSVSVKILLAVSLFSFVVKLLLQTLSAHPVIAQVAYTIRNYVMAYLHLVLLGMISTFLIAWCIDKGWIGKSVLSWVLIFLVGAHALTPLRQEPSPPASTRTNFIKLTTLLFLNL